MDRSKEKKINRSLKLSVFQFLEKIVSSLNFISQERNNLEQKFLLSYFNIFIEVNIMATEKENVMQMIKELPDDITLEDIMYHLYAREKIICGLKDADEGKKVSNEKAKEVIEKWFE